MVLNYLSFCLSVKLLISPSYLNEILVGSVIWVLFHHFKYVLPFSSGLKSFYWKVGCYPMGIPLWVICCFSFTAFNICSLCLIFINLINMCLGVFCLRFILFGTLWVSWTWVAISFPILGKFSTIISWNIFSCPFFSCSSYGTPMIWMLGHLTLSQWFLRLPSFLFSTLLKLFPTFYI